VGSASQSSWGRVTPNAWAQSDSVRQAGKSALQVGHGGTRSVGTRKIVRSGKWSCGLRERLNCAHALVSGLSCSRNANRVVKSGTCVWAVRTRFTKALDHANRFPVARSMAARSPACVHSLAKSAAAIFRKKRVCRSIDSVWKTPRADRRVSSGTTNTGVASPKPSCAHRSGGG